MGLQAKLRLGWLLLIVTWAMAPHIALGAAAVGAAPAEQFIQEQSETLPTSEIEQYWRKLSADYGGYFPENQMPSFRELLAPGGEGISFSGLIRGLLQFFFFEIVHNGKLLVSIVVLTVFSAVLQTVQSAFERTSISKIAYAICYLVIMIMAINSFSVAIGFARSAIESMIHFMTAMIPLLLMMLASVGQLATVSVMHPLIVFMIHTVGTLIYTFVFPLLFFSAVLHLVSSLTDKYKVTQLANLMRTVSIGALGIMLTAFLGVLTVQGATSSVTDGVTIRTAKYITGNFVPVVGKMFTDATDTVISAS